MQTQIANTEKQLNFSEYRFGGDSTKSSPRSGKQIFRIELGSDYLVWSLHKGTQVGMAGLLTDDDFSDPNKAINHLERLCDDLSLKKAEIDLFISLPDGLLRCFYIPVVPNNELEQVVSWEGNKVFPFDLQDAYFDWKIKEQFEWSGSKKYEVQAAAIPKKKISPLISYLIEKQFVIRRVTFTSLAWENIVEYNCRKTHNDCGNMALVRLVGHDLTILFFHNYFLEFLRENNLEAGSLGGGYEESLRFLDSPGGGSVSGGMIADSLDFEMIGRNISDSMDYYHGQFSQRTLDKIALAFPPEVQDYAIESLTDLLDIPVISAYPDNLVQKLPGSPFNILLPSAYPVGPQKNNLNLRPHEYVQKLQEKQRFQSILGGGVVLFFLLAVLSFIQFRQLATSEQSLEMINNDLEALQSSEAYSQIHQLSEREGMLSSQLATVRNQDYRLSAFLKALSLVTPEEIRLTALNLDAELAEGGVYTGTLSGFIPADRGYPEVALADYIKHINAVDFVLRSELKRQDITLNSSGKRLEFSLDVELK